MGFFEHGLGMNCKAINRAKIQHHRRNSFPSRGYFRTAFTKCPLRFTIAGAQFCEFSEVVLFVPCMYEQQRYLVTHKVPRPLPRDRGPAAVQHDAASDAYQAVLYQHFWQFVIKCKMSTYKQQKDRKMKAVQLWGCSGSWCWRHTR